MRSADHAAVLAQDLDRRAVESEAQDLLPRCQGRLLGLVRARVPVLGHGGGPLLELCEDLPRPAIGLPVLAGELVVIEIGRVDHHGEPLDLAHLAQLEGGELGPRGPAATDHGDHLGGGAVEPLADVLGDVGRLELLRGAHEHPCHIQRDIAHAHHSGALGGQVPLRVDVGVAVVPGDELGGAVRADQVLSGDAHGPVGEGAGGEDRRVIVAAQVLEHDVGAELHVAEEADAWVRTDRVQGVGDALDTRVVRGDAVPQETEGHREGIELVDHDLLLVLISPVQQRFTGVHAGRTRADHGNSQRGS